MTRFAAIANLQPIALGRETLGRRQGLGGHPPQVGGTYGYILVHAIHVVAIAPWGEGALLTTGTLAKGCDSWVWLLHRQVGEAPGYRSV
jgi:hypothetical protein